MENNGFAPRVHIFFYLKCMLVSPAAHAPANRVRNKTWHSKFLHRPSIRKFFFYENNFLKVISREKTGYTVAI